MAETLDLRRAVMRCGGCGQRFGEDATFCPFDGAKLESVTWDPAGDPLLRRVIDGRYEIVGVLGEGGMGTVYQVRHTTLDRLFAMKVLRRDLANDADLAARFMREARATASLKHPNIVAINDFGRLSVAEHELPYFVMEHLVGQTLARAIKLGGALPAALGMKIVLKIAHALDAAHAERIVHRDLKPDNVFLLGGLADARAGAIGSKGESAGVLSARRPIDVRVVDFGAALILGASRVTKAGIVFGTPHYMSPEQASGQPVDHRADIYALGVIMYEMFTGRVPFVADTYMGVLTQHMFVKPVPPSRVSERARELGALEGVILRALEKKPEQRYGTMQELAADIERLSSFAADGSLSLRVGPGADVSGDVSRPTFAVANALEPVERGELGASFPSVVTRSSVSNRRARARTWLTYGSVAVGVAAATLAIVRLLQPNRAAGPSSPVVAAGSASVSPAEPPAAPVVSPLAPPPPARSEPAAPIAPAARSAPHPPRPKPAPAPMPGDFADPWAK